MRQLILAGTFLTFLVTSTLTTAQTAGTGFSLGTVLTDPFGTGVANQGWGSSSQNGSQNHLQAERSDTGDRIDMDGDGNYEVVAVNAQGSDNLVIFEATGDNTYAKVWGFGLNASNLNSAGLAVADTDGDSRLEIVVADGASDLLRIFEFDPTLGGGAILDGVNPPDTPVLSRAVTDPIALTAGLLDGDALVDIVITSTDDTDSLTVVEATANDSWAASTSTSVGTLGSGASGISRIADLDGDGTAEVVVGPDFQARADDAFYVYTWDGSSFSVETTLAIDATNGGGRNTALLADIDDNGTSEIILVDQGTNDRVYVYEATGANTYAADAGASGILILGDQIIASALGDRDADGDHELYFTFDDNTHVVIYYEHTGADGSFTAADFGSQQVLVTLDSANKDPRDIAIGMGSLDTGGDTRGDFLITDQDARLIPLESTADGSQLPVELIEFSIGH